MYYILKIYYEKRKRAKFKFNVDKEYLAHVKNLINGIDKFISIGNVIIDRNRINHIVLKAVLKKEKKL